MNKEEKAKAYGEALKLAREKREIALRNGADITVKFLEEIFPQLTESEDERIRLALISHFRTLSYDLSVNGFSKEDFIAYLEKQKEQKPVEEINIKALLTADRLASAEMTGRLKERNEILENPDKYGLQKPAEWSLSELKMFDDILVAICLDNAFTEGRRKELINLLNTCRCGISYIKSVEWSEEDKKMREQAVQQMNLLEEYIDDGSFYTERAKEASKEACYSVRAWLKSLPERFNLQPKQEWGYEDEKKYKSIIWHLKNPVNNEDLKWAIGQLEDWFKSLHRQPKQEWDEVDKRLLGKCIDTASGYYNPEDKQVLKDWLKSLPERFNLQPKQEWSETESNALETVINFLEYKADFSTYGGYGREYLIEKLKSLRPHPHWKPNEEQMEALNEAIGDEMMEDTASCEAKAEVLKTLYADLNKLM